MEVIPGLMLMGWKEKHSPPRITVSVQEVLQENFPTQTFFDIMLTIDSFEISKQPLG